MSKSNRIGDHWRDQQPYFPDDEPPLEIAPTPYGVCPECLGALELYEGETYCPDCTTFSIPEEVMP